MATFITCKRCEGKGRLAHFGHVNNGVCLKCCGTGKVMKMRNVVTLVTHYRAVADNDTVVLCDTDKARAEALVAEWATMNVQGAVETREVKKTEKVPA